MRSLDSIYNLLDTYSFVNDLTEDGLQGPKYVGGPSQYSKYLCLYAQLVGLNNVQSSYCTRKIHSRGNNIQKAMVSSFNTTRTRRQGNGHCRWV